MFQVKVDFYGSTLMKLRMDPKLFFHDKQIRPVQYGMCNL